MVGEGAAADGADWAMETMGADAIDATIEAENTKNPVLWEQGGGSQVRIQPPQH